MAREIEERLIACASGAVEGALMGFRERLEACVEGLKRAIELEGAGEIHASWQVLRLVGGIIEEEHNRISDHWYEGVVKLSVKDNWKEP